VYQYIRPQNDQKWTEWVFEIHSSIYVTEFPSNKIGSFATLNCDKKTAELRHFYGRFLKSIMKLVYTRGVV